MKLCPDAAPPAPSSPRPPAWERDWVARPDDPALLELLRELLRVQQEQRHGAVGPALSVEESAARVGAIDLERPVGLRAALSEAAELMRQGDLSSASARCFGYFNPTAAWPAVLADLLVGARNPQLAVVTHASASAAIERRVIAHFQERLGLPASGLGNFTSGGSEANASALAVALVRAEPRFAEEGVVAFRGAPRLYASSDAHLAWLKIARAAGLGTRAVRLAPTDGRGRLDPAALRALLERDVAAGCVPVMIAATAGTTNAGEIDPLRASRALADEFGAHLHVDAAWAGALALDPERRALLDGIEQADSVTVDAHKWLSVPMGAGMFFARDADAVRRAWAVRTGYMPAGDGVDAYVTTSQWSRRFLGVRLWMMLRASGEASYARLFERHFALAEHLRSRLPEFGFRQCNQSPLPVVVFEDERHGVGARALADALEADGAAYLGCVEYEGQSALRFCPTSFLSREADVELLLERLSALRDRLGSEERAR